MENDRYVEIEKASYDHSTSVFKIVVNFIDKEREEINELEIVLPKREWYFMILRLPALEDKQMIQGLLEKYAERNKMKYESIWQNVKKERIFLSKKDLD